VDLASLADGAESTRREWSDLHAALAVVGPGEWTTYGDLAELIGTSAQPVGNHVANCADCPNAYRVLGHDGRASTGFRWADSAETRTCQQVLEGEGLVFTDGRADATSRLELSVLRARVAAK